MVAIDLCNMCTEKRRNRLPSMMYSAQSCSIFMPLSIVNEHCKPLKLVVVGILNMNGRMYNQLCQVVIICTEHTGSEIYLNVLYIFAKILTWFSDCVVCIISSLCCVATVFLPSARSL